MSSESYVREINSLDTEIKRLNAIVKRLREQKRQAQTNLHSYMVSRGLEQVGEGKQAITIRKCAPPKPRPKTKPKKDRKAEAIELFRDAGIPDPNSFYEQFESIQKAKLEQAESEEASASSASKVTSSTTRSGKPGAYDDMLGF